LEEDDVIGTVAENAGGLIFLQNDLIFVGEDLERVFFVDVHYLSDAYGENYSSKLVYFPCDTC
jgi:hypothetical protein